MSTPTRHVRVTLRALVALEHFEVIEVPANTTEDELEALVEARYQDVDGGAYYDDPDYWERGTCSWEPSEPGETPSARAVRRKGGFVVSPLPTPAAAKETP